MARRHEGHDLVAHLPAAHRLACLLVAGLQQQPEEVVVLGVRFRGPLVHHPRDDRVELLDGGKGAPAPRPHAADAQRPLAADPRDLAERADRDGPDRRDSLPQHAGHRLADRARRLARQVGAEQRAAHDVERDRVHRLGGVDPGPVWQLVVPAVERGLRGAGHVDGEVVEVALGEHGLHEAALVAPGLPLVGQQASAEDHRQHPVLGRLPVVVLVGDKDVPGRLVVAHEAEAVVDDVKLRHRAMAVGHLGQRAERRA